MQHCSLLTVACHVFVLQAFLAQFRQHFDLKVAEPEKPLQS